MRVKLFFRTMQDSSFERKVRGLEMVRLKALVQFKTDGGWTDVYEAIVDTGAPLSLLPRSIWGESECAKIADHKVRGIVSERECSMEAKLGRLTGRVLDWEGNQTNDLEMYAFLAPTDRVPLIIGFKGLLSELSAHLDYPNKEAYIEG